MKPIQHHDQESRSDSMTPAKMLQASIRYEEKQKAERAVIDAAVVWRRRETSEHGEYVALMNAIDRLIALG